jgi:hypothetical protein
MYKLTQTSSIIRLNDNAIIPDDPANVDWQTYQGWLAQNNVPEPYVPPSPVVPVSVTMRQARLVLLQAGLLAAINTAITDMTGPEGDAARITWEFSSEVHRNNPLVTMLAAKLNLTDAQLDDLFTLAATL